MKNNGERSEFKVSRISGKFNEVTKKSKTPESLRFWPLLVCFCLIPHLQFLIMKIVTFADLVYSDKMKYQCATYVI